MVGCHVVSCMALVQGGGGGGGGRKAGDFSRLSPATDQSYVGGR